MPSGWRSVLEIAIAAGLHLRQSGRSYTALCPFHEESTPSFNIDPTRGYGGSWRCFGCGRGGYAPHLDELLNGREPRPARPTGRRIEPRAAVPERSASAQDMAVLDLSIVALDAWLWESGRGDSDALAYLRVRGFSPAVIRWHRLGFGRWSILPVLAEAGYGLNEASASGLVTGGRRVYQRFRGRVVIPEIRGGHVVHATGRALRSRAAPPKYLDLSFDPLLWHLRCALRKRSDAIYVVEGQLDALACCQAGIAAVAIGCSDPGPRQLRELRWVVGRKGKRLIAWGDDDETGSRLNAKLAELGAVAMVAGPDHDAAESLSTGGIARVRAAAASMRTNKKEE
ncbi:MAG: CHC2 zinc finger domain-containing protein [Chloroflexota bacterium]